jgi:anti-sigma B factor antagonist
MSIVVSFASYARAVVASPDGEVDFDGYQQLREQLVAALEKRPPVLVVDLSRTRFLDSTALGALAATARRARQLGCAFCLAAVPPAIARMLAATALDRAWPIYSTVTEALDAHGC